MNCEHESPLNYYQQRIININYLKSKNIDPYPHYYDITHSINELRDWDSKINDGEHLDDIIIKTSGRIILKRSSGKKLHFYTLEDQNDNIQIMASENNYLEDKFLNEPQI